ncbi:MAG: outer membrane protein transport protein [Magnetococcales bacterium]|nr:outer membrane protein transport protein [Magnetococcales bacterium]
MLKQRTAMLLALPLLLPLSAHASNGYFSHGFGTANKGLAGAGVAFPSDAMGTAINPALMAHVGSRLDLGLAVMSPDRGFTANTPSSTAAPFIPPGTYESDNDYFFIPHIGYNRMLDAKSSLGLSIGGNGGMNTEYDSAVFANFSTGTTSSPTGIDLAQMFVGLNYAREIFPGQTLGIAPIGAMQWLKVEGLEPFEALSIHPDNVTNKDYDYSFGGGVRVGWLGEFTDWFSVGASYQSRLWMSKFDKYEGLLAEEGGFDIPPIIQAGIAIKPLDNLTILFDVQEILFGEVDSLSNSNNMVLTAGALGGDDGLGFGWVDMTVYKIGVDWKVNEDWELRLGFSTADDVLPSGQALFNILAPATVTEHLTFGFTARLSDDSQLNFAYMHAFEEEIHGTNPNTPFQTGYLEMNQNEIEISWSKRF